MPLQDLQEGGQQRGLREELKGLIKAEEGKKITVIHPRELWFELPPEIEEDKEKASSSILHYEEPEAGPEQRVAHHFENEVGLNISTRTTQILASLRRGSAVYSAGMAKSKNHTAHNQSYKAHKNGIKKAKKHKYTSRKGMDPKFLRNQRYAKKYNRVGGADAGSDSGAEE
ncbi:hypothetical protein L7F22_066635 [Adiantum nelumboides]|nr:hypothetical protein [Adiantum nelumboides]